MKTPTIVKTTKDYMLIKVPLPKPEHMEFQPVRPGEKFGRTEKRLWRIVQEGEKEYQKGKLKPVKSLRELMR